MLGFGIIKQWQSKSLSFFCFQWQRCALISVVTISSETAELENVIITDLTGKIIKQKTLNGVENNLDISDLSSGAYFFTVKGNSISETIKVMKN